MPGQIVSANTLTAGLRADFANTYKATYEASKSKLMGCMEMGIPSDKLTELYGFFDAAPYPRLWRRGEGIPRDAMNSTQFNVTNRDWAVQISWHENDREDDQTRSLMDRARDAGAHYATLPERVFFQLLTAAVDNNLLPSLPNAPDGAALFSATTGGGDDRFNVSGGNVVSGGGVSSSNLVRDDFFAAIERLRQFQDTANQPLWSDSLLDKGMVVTYGVANDQAFREAFQQGRTLAAATSVTGNAAVSNIILESGLQIELWPTQRISDDDWFVFAKGAPHKPVFQQVRTPLRESYANVDNSDLARETKIESISWDSREGFGVTVPYQCVKVNN